MLKLKQMKITCYKLSAQKIANNLFMTEESMYDKYENLIDIITVI